MSSLRELSAELAQVADLANDPDVPPEAIMDTLQGLEGMFKEKAVKVVHILANSDADIEVIEQEIKRLQARKQTMVNGKKHLVNYLRMNMESTGITKISSPLFNITLVSGRAVVVVEDADKLPAEYQVEHPATWAPDKKKILAALKEGVDIPGAAIGTGQSSVRIK